MGDREKASLRLQFNPQIRLELHGATITSDAGLLAFRELDVALDLTPIASDYLQESRTGRNIRHHLVPLLRQSIYSRLAGYDDTNDAERLSQDPAMRVVVGWQGSDRNAARTNTMSRFETETLTQEDNLSPNPPMDRDGRREDSGRGEGVTGAMIRARIWVDGRLAGGLQALLGAPMAAYSGCGEGDGGIGHGKRRWRTGVARDCGDVGLAGGSVADGRRQAGSGMARSRARARLNCSSQGQRRGRCRVNRRAERVIRPAKAKTRRLRVLVVTIC